MGWNPLEDIKDATKYIDPTQGFGVPDLVSDLTSVPDQPAAPDYTGAAEATAAGNLEMAQYTTDVNRPDMFNPYGSSTWTQGFDQPGYDEALIAAQDKVGYYPDQQNFLLPDGTLDEGRWQQAIDAYNAKASGFVDKRPFEGTGGWENIVDFSPEQQALFEQGQRTDLLQGDLAYQGLQATEDLFSTPYKTGLDPLGNYSDQRSGLISAMMARTDEDVAQDRDAKRSQLVAQGIPVGSDAFAKEMKAFDRRLTDAQQQAEIAATQQISTMMSDDRATRGQTVSEALLERQTPLNELAALRSGTSVSNPAFQDFSQQQQILGPDYLGAETSQGAWDLAGWNADVAQQNALTSGLFDLGSAYVGAPTVPRKK